jgi:hypothetical protein
MASPLLSIANSLILVTSQGVPTVTNGRITAAVGTKYLVNAYMKRAQYGGVSSGSKKVPLYSELGGNMMPGASGDQFYYRGYALQYGVVSSTFELGVTSTSGISWSTVTAQNKWLLPSIEVQFQFGNDPILRARVERSSGVFGGQGIDEIIYSEIGGVELQLTGNELQN